MKNTVQIALVAANHALANNDAAVTDITRLVTNFNEKGKRPFYIYCSITGEKKGMSQLPVFQKRLELAGGDILAMFATYKSREPKKLAPKPEPTVEVVEVPSFEVVESTIEAPEASIEVTDVVSAEETPKERRNRLRREKAAQEKANREAKLAEQAA